MNKKFASSASVIYVVLFVLAIIAELFPGKIL